MIYASDIKDVTLKEGIVSIVYSIEPATSTADWREIKMTKEAFLRITSLGRYITDQPQ